MFKKILISFALFSGWVYSSAQITTSIIAPAANMPVGDFVTIKTKITSALQVNSAVATAGNQQANLVYNQSTSYFEGTIAIHAINGIKQDDTVNITVTVTDILNNQQMKNVKVIYDLPPIVTVKEPLNESVARPVLPVKIYSTDKDTCTIVLSYLGTAVFTGKIKDSLSTTINLGAYNGNSGEFTITVTDKRNQKSADTLIIHVDTSSALVEYFAADSKIFDFNYNKVLVAGSNISYPAIITITGNQRETIPLLSILSTAENRSYLTPYGAVLTTARDSFNTGYRKYDWNNHTIYHLQVGAQNGGVFSLKAAGNYAMWSDGTTLIRRDLGTRTNTTLSTNAGVTDNDVAANGAVAYWSYDYNLYFYKNNTTSVLATYASGRRNIDPATDGNMVVYTKNDRCCAVQTYSIYMAEPGVGETELSYLGTQMVVPRWHYHVNNKYIAYSKLGTSGQIVTWLRDTAGNHTQISFVGEDTRIEEVSPKGDVVFKTSAKRYLAARNSQLKEVNSTVGVPYYRDSSWYMVIGRMIYKITPSAVIITESLTTTIVAPTVNKLTGDASNVKVSIKSTSQVNSAVATAGNQQANLVYNQSTSYFEGTIPIGSIAGIKQGDTVSITVTVTDIQNNQQTKSVKVIYDLPPTVTVKEPLNESVARPAVPVKIFSTDKDTCTLVLTYLGNTVFTGKIKDSLSTTVNLSAYNGNSGEFIVTVTDKQNQKTADTLTIHVDTSSALVEYFAADSKIFDFNYNKALVAGTNLSYPSIITIAGNQRETIPLLSILSTAENRSYLTPYGAVLTTARDSVNFSYHGYDWNNHTIYSLQAGALNSPFSLKAAGNYAIWSNSTTLIRRDLATRTNTTLSTNVGVTDNDVAANGTVAYWGYDYNIYFYQNNINTVLSTTTGNKQNSHTSTDGNIAVYRKHDPGATIQGPPPALQRYSIYMATPAGGETELSDFGTKLIVPHWHYHVKNKYIAYAKLGTSGQTVTWLRDTAGNHTQISFIGADTHIDEVGPNGDVVFKTPSKRYLSARNSQLKEINSTVGIPYYRDSSWYIVIGRMIYKMEAPATGQLLNLLNFTAQKEPAANTLKWSLADYTGSIYYKIEKSTGLSNFSTIGKVNTLSDSTYQHSYQFNDTKPGDAVNFYRLKMVFADSSYKYSSVIKINNTTEVTIALAPNPANAILNLRINTPVDQSVKVEILSLSGRVLYTTSFTTIQGYFSKGVNISAFQRGLYYTRLTTSDGIITRPFFKL
jgi:hypothetical protein